MTAIALCATVLAINPPATLVDHPIISALAPVYLDGSNWTASSNPGSSKPDSRVCSPPKTVGAYAACDQMLPSDRNSFVHTYTDPNACLPACQNSSSCKGFTQTSSDCWIYDVVPSLVFCEAGVTYFSKSSALPPHPLPPPPSPPPPPISISATVPGDILTDLQRAGKLPDPYFNSSWQDSSFIAMWNEGTWTYTRSFAAPASSMSSLLVFDGIRMGSMIKLNGESLGNSTDQFQRYVFPVKLQSSNELSITFGAELGIETGGRFTFSAQIDWAPTMHTKEASTCKGPQGCRSTFGFGVWKSVYLVPVPAAAHSAVITHVVPVSGLQV
jgi:hypothetical protein